VFRSRVDVVEIGVSVKSGNRPVAGLTADDFALADNGVPQQISSIAVERLPIDFTLLLDLSSSVDGAALDRLKAAVRDTAALLRPDDRIRLIAISQVLREVFGFQARGESLPLESLAAEGATSLYDGLAAAMMRPTEAGRRQLVIAFTDGRDSTSIVDEATAHTLARLTDTVVDIVVPLGAANAANGNLQALAPLSPAASAARTPVYAGSSSDLSRASQALKPWAQQDTVPAGLAELVNPTTGQVFPVTSGESISALFKKMFEDFRATYVLQYVPQGVARGGWHDVTVTLKKPGKYDVRSRNGYSGGALDPPISTGADLPQGWGRISKSELK